MCQKEEITYRCGHQIQRVCKYCHFARNDPLHQCMGAWSIKRRETVSEYCPTCVAYAYQQSHTESSSGHSQKSSRSSFSSC